MAFTQGAPLPDIKETTTTATAAPDYYTNYLSGLSQAGQTALRVPAAQGVAGLDALQTQGYEALPGAATAYRPGLSAAEQTAAQAAGVGSEDIQRFMNPYTKNVVDEMTRLSQQNVQRNVMPMLKAGFVGSGGLGGQRYAGALGQTLGDIQSDLTGKQYGALSSGYSDALKAALSEAQLQNQVAGTQGQLARAEQELGLAGANALTKAGAEKQAYQQSILDYPLKQATNVAGLLRGFTQPTTQTQTFVGPRAGAYQKSPFEITSGLLSLLGAATTGTATDRITDFLKSLYKGDTTTSGGNINWDEISKIISNEGAAYGGSGGSSGDPYNPDTGGDSTYTNTYGEEP